MSWMQLPRRTADLQAASPTLVPTRWCASCSRARAAPMRSARCAVRPQKQRALTKDPMQQLLTTCDDSIRGICDRALLLFA